MLLNEKQQAKKTKTQPKTLFLPILNGRNKKGKN